MKKLIFFDIDGTLLTEGSSHYVPDSTAQALEMLKKNGHICIINTGRPYSALDNVIMSINVSGYICGCGTYIRLDNDVLLAHHLSSELCREIIHELCACKIEWLLEGENAIYYSDKEYHTQIKYAVDGYLKDLPDKIHCIDENDCSNVIFDKFCIAVTSESNLSRFRSHFSDKLTFIDRGNSFFEIVPNNYSKATGMKFLEEYLNIDHKNTYAVGDSSNDIPMLEYANTSILMGNAETSLHGYADYITDSVTENGIFNAFRHFELI